MWTIADTRKALEVEWNGMQWNGLSENETETELFVWLLLCITFSVYMQKLRMYMYGSASLSLEDHHQPLAVEFVLQHRSLTITH